MLSQPLVVAAIVVCRLEKQLDVRKLNTVKHALRSDVMSALMLIFCNSILDLRGDTNLHFARISRSVRTEKFYNNISDCIYNFQRCPIASRELSRFGLHFSLARFTIARSLVIIAGKTAKLSSLRTGFSTANTISTHMYVGCVYRCYIVARMNIRQFEYTNTLVQTFGYSTQYCTYVGFKVD